MSQLTQRSQFQINHATKSYLCTTSQDSTKKVLLLQDQLLKLRKEMSTRQMQWEKEKNHLMNRQQILHMETIELKQRISNLSQVNQTLSDAVSSNVESEHLRKQIRMLAARMVGDGELAAKLETRIRSKPSSDVPKYNEKNQELQKLEQKLSNTKQKLNFMKEKTQIAEKTLEQKDKLIHSQNEDLARYRQKIQKQQEQILECHKEISRLTRIQELYEEKVKQTNAEIKPKNNYLSKQPKQLSLSELGDFDSSEKKYPQRHSYLMVKPTPDYSQEISQNSSSYFNKLEVNEEPSSYPLYSQDEQYESEDDKLLCEQCEKVFPFEDFQSHMRFCGARGEIRNLIEKKKLIENRLQNLRICQETENNKQKQNQNKTFYVVQSSKQSRDSNSMQSEIKEIIKLINNNPKNNNATRRHRTNTTQPKLQQNNSQYAQFSIRQHKFC